jgi:hypothetical protein
MAAGGINSANQIVALREQLSKMFDSVLKTITRASMRIDDGNHESHSEACSREKQAQKWREAARCQ